MNENKVILFFDGHCNLCNFFVDWVLRWDRKNKIKLASIQGKTAPHYLNPGEIKSLHTVILVKEGQHFVQSAAVFQVFWILKGPLLLFMPFWLLPRPLTDWLYSKVSQHRYRLFGKRDHCRLPTESERKHFLD